jgi:general secretion pathway protein G
MKKAFSLIEIMIVIIILGIMTTLIMPNLLDKGDKAKEDLVCVQMQNIAQSLDMFRVDNGSYPSTSNGLKALVKNPDEEKYPSYAKNGYFKNGVIPKDSWKRAFIYVLNDDKFEIISLGVDGKEGGKKDIKYSDCVKQ